MGPSFLLEGNTGMMKKKIDTICFSKKYEGESTAEQQHFSTAASTLH
jgi:hypothetical protein